MCINRRVGKYLEYIKFLKKSFKVAFRSGKTGDETYGSC